jgi:hypothetical protein
LGWALAQSSYVGRGSAVPESADAPTVVTVATEYAVYCTGTAALRHCSGRLRGLALQPRTGEQKLQHCTYRIATLYVSDCNIVHIALQPVDTLTDEQKLRLKEYKAFKEEQDKYLKALNTERTKLLSEVAKIKTTLDERIDELYNKRTKEVTSG